MADISLEGLSPDAVSGLALLAKGLSDNPDTRNEFLKLTKRANPSLSIPEVDIPFGINAELATERGKREALEKEMMKDRIERDVEKRRASLMSSQGLSESDVTAVEKLMVEKNIPSHETAAEYFKMQQKSATPTPSFTENFGSRQVPKPETKDFGGNIAQWARAEAAKTINDIRSGVIKVG